MPKTGIKKENLRDFFSYHKMIYVLLTICVWILADLLYNATQYQVPNEKQVHFMLVSTTAETEGMLRELEVSALADGQEFDPTLEEVFFQRIAFDPNNDMDGTGGQQYMVMLGVGEGDIYRLPEDLMLVLVKEGYALPLEGYIESGILDPGDVDLSKVTFGEPEDLEDYDPTAKHIYAIPMANLYRMMLPDINVDNRAMYMVLMVYSENPDTSAYVMDYVIEQLTYELPEGVVPAVTPVPEGYNPFDDALEGAGFATAAPTEAPAAE